MELLSDILEINNNFEPKLLARLHFDGKLVRVVKGSKNILSIIDMDGVVGKDQKVYRSEDGEKFMRALPFQYTGSRFRATLQERK